MMKLTRTGAVAIAAFTTSVVLAGCGGAGTASVGAAGAGEPTEAEAFYEEMAALSGTERREALVEAAEEEGQLALYTSMTSDITAAVEEEFEKAFDIKIEVYRAGSSDVLTKIAQEVKGNSASADVVETNALELLALNQMGVLAEYAGERRDMVGEEGQYETWTATRYNVFSPSWNTDLVSVDEAPKSWEELADPKWDGRLALELEDYDWFMALHQYWEEQGKSQEEIDQLFGDIRDGAEVQKGHTAMADQHQAGAFDVAASNYTYIVEQKKRDGAPLDYLPLVDPVFARANGFGLLKSAAHPAAAMLFADWLLEEGQQLMFDRGLIVAIVPEGADDPMADVEVRYVDNIELAENSDKWDEAYQELLQGGGGQ
ncbi:hypothetical protein ASD19_00255 [Microbacterium sp. Root53]|uniref:ABC transporter substrate-binding protein n=1 Tax=Microbacterium sp. Root53 TaxID=1736553 RepID=UPI0006FD0821|nr:extracellular solute-binding protein [Microbacterium sp. Root53]KQZ11756.1 hypothetical protein ASD19_00255 [Microbacterium sp. Root53]